MTALMISTITVKDQDKLRDYLRQVQPLGRRYGAEMVFRGSAAGTVAGQIDHQMVVIARFPSAEAIDGMFSAPDYAPLLTLREEASDQVITKYLAAD